MRRVALTGIGAVTPVGNDRETTWRSLLEGRSGIGPITSFDASTYPVRIAGMVEGFELEPRLPDPHLARHLARGAGFGVAATLEALADAGLDEGNGYEPEERGIAMGGHVGRPSLQQMTDITYPRHMSEGRELFRQPPGEVIQRDQNTAVAAMAQLAGCAGPAITVSTACTASAHAIGEGYRRIQDGEVKMMVAGGCDALTSWLDVLGFSLLGALTRDYNDDPERASRPFERDRNGFVLGEGGVVTILEDLDAARERGAPVYAEIVGYGSSLNAWRMTDAPPDGGGGTIAIANAVRESALPHDQIDYVAAHGTGTPGNDLSETMALKGVFGEGAARLAVSSPKSMTGHTTAASGALNVLVAACALRDQAVPPTINYDNPDPKLDLDYVPNEGREMTVRAVVTDAFAFGGTNASLVLRRPDDVEVRST